jgi:hypothetical protein
MNLPRYQHTATLLNNGSVLVTGGIISTNGINNYNSTAELYNPQTGTWRYTGVGSQTGMNSARAGHTATLLSDGRVLIAGGAYFTQFNSGVGVYPVRLHGRGPRKPQLHSPKGRPYPGAWRLYRQFSSRPSVGNL